MGKSENHDKQCTYLALDLDPSSVRESKLIILLSGEFGDGFGTMNLAWIGRRLNARGDIHGITKQTKSGVSRAHHIRHDGATVQSNSELDKAHFRFIRMDGCILRRIQGIDGKSSHPCGVVALGLS